jgi:hypothetical protein
MWSGRLLWLSPIPVLLMVWLTLRRRAELKSSDFRGNRDRTAAINDGIAR